MKRRRTNLDDMRKTFLPLLLLLLLLLLLRFPNIWTIRSLEGWNCGFANCGQWKMGKCQSQMGLEA
jgi:hypothetical protein